MDPATAANTIFFRNATDLIDIWAQNSTIRQLWDLYPKKQSWMVNKFYNIEPVKDELNDLQGAGRFSVNKVQNKISEEIDGFFFLITGSNMRFDYWSNGKP